MGPDMKLPNIGYHISLRGGAWHEAPKHLLSHKPAWWLCPSASTHDDDDDVDDDDDDDDDDFDSICFVKDLKDMLASPSIYDVTYTWDLQEGLLLSHQHWANVTKLTLQQRQ